MRASFRVAATTLLLVSGVAGAQTSNVSIYGLLIPFMESVGITGATSGVPSNRPAQQPASAYTGVNPPTRGRMTAGTSNFGIRGSEELGGGLRAIFQIESSVGLDGEPPSVLAGRNSNVGLAGAWGTVFLGNWDTPYKWALLTSGAGAPLFGLTPWDYGNLLQTPGFNVPVTTTQPGRINAKADAAFNRRQGNSLQYWTPVYQGLSGRIAYSVAEGKTDATPTSAGTDPDLLSLAVNYDNNALLVRYAYEQHRDYFGLAQIGGTPGATLSNSSSRDDGHEIVARYRLPWGQTVAAMYERLKYRTSESVPGQVASYQRDAWNLTLQQPFGAQTVWLMYGNARDGKCTRAGGGDCSTHALGAQQWLLGYKYVFSRRTQVFATGGIVDNRESGTYSVFPPLAASTPPGGRTRGVGVGIEHAF